MTRNTPERKSGRVRCTQNVREPYARIGPVRICAGGGWQQPSLPRMPAATEITAGSGGRRPKASKGDAMGQRRGYCVHRS
jgi:hypothetical protein